MQHARLFRKLREQRGLTIEALAKLSHVSRGTIINLEAGRQVKIITLERLMNKMGFVEGSREMDDVKRLWAESKTGVSALPGSDVSIGAQRKSISYRRDASHYTTTLLHAIRLARLDEREIRLLIFAVGNPAIMEIISSVHDLLQAAAADKADLKAAEDK
jgi:transcriptional regulator with XRE-family HTH domain